MTLETMILLVVLLAILSAPVFPYSREWGYRPFSLVGAVFVLLVVVYFLGRHHLTLRL